MPRSPIRLLALLSVASLLAAPAFAQAPPPCPGAQSPGCIWKATNPVPLLFNASLDPNLEQVRLYRDPANPALIRMYTLGNAATRWECFQQAVNAWNVALTNLCGQGNTPFQLTAAQSNDWATDQQTADCLNSGLVNPDDAQLPHAPATNDPVSDRKTFAHIGDGKNATSTGMGAGMVLPGWIYGNGVGTYTVDARLGETYPNCDNGDVSKLKEADVAWMTHFSDSNPPCQQIAWDYRYMPNAADPDDPGAPVPYKGGGGKPGPDAYDFYSVMLHEIGHVLGLGHMIDPGGKNVMIGQLAPGDRQQITATEIACLKQLYCNAATPTRGPTWGQLKSLYR